MDTVFLGESAHQHGSKPPAVFLAAHYPQEHVDSFELRDGQVEAENQVRRNARFIHAGVRNTGRIAALQHRLLDMPADFRAAGRLCQPVGRIHQVEKRGFRLPLMRLHFHYGAGQPQRRGA